MNYRNTHVWKSIWGWNPFEISLIYETFDLERDEIWPTNQNCLWVIQESSINRLTALTKYVPSLFKLKRKPLFEEKLKSCEAKKEYNSFNSERQLTSIGYLIRLYKNLSTLILTESLHFLIASKWYKWGNRVCKGVSPHRVSFQNIIRM